MTNLDIKKNLEEFNKNTSVNGATLEIAHQKYLDNTSNDRDYHIAYDLYHNKGLQVEGILFLLYSWNRANMVHFVDQVDMFIKVFNEAKPLFNSLETFKFESVVLSKTDKLSEFEEKTLKLFKLLSFSDMGCSKNFVGASKAMHLVIPRLFIPWDRKIANFVGLDVDYPSGYIKFFRLIKAIYATKKTDFDIALNNLQTKNKNLFFPKLIDEYLYSKEKGWV